MTTRAISRASVCPGCGKSFQPKKPQAKYCSRLCFLNTNKGWMGRKTPLVRLRRCLGCGVEFNAPKPRSTYCSKPCFCKHNEAFKSGYLVSPHVPPNHRPWDGGTRPDFSGRLHPMFGKKHTPDAIKKIKAKRALQGRINIGESHWNWRGGVSGLRDRIYKSFTFKRWRKAVFRRDNYTCQQCGERGGIIHSHHKIPFSKLLRLHSVSTVEDAIRCEPMWDVSNGVTLCKLCHSKTDSYSGRANKLCQ